MIVKKVENSWKFKQISEFRHHTYEVGHIEVDSLYILEVLNLIKILSIMQLWCDYKISVTLNQ